MMLRTQWYPFEDLRSTQDERTQNQIDRLFAHALGLHGQWQGATGASILAWAPALDIAERKDGYLVTVELPGVKLDDLEITLEDGLLTIQGERRSDHLAGQVAMGPFDGRSGSAVNIVLDR